jgi:shikimate kinase
MTPAGAPVPRPPAKGAGPKAVLIGPPGSGKSTVAKGLAREWGVARRDTDDDIVRMVGKSISDVFLDDGEAAFRELEAKAVALALVEHDGILSLGGGAILNPDTQALLETYKANGGDVIFLDVSLSAAAPRVGLNNARPLLVGNPRRQWADLMAARRPIYERLATRTVNTDHLNAKRIAQEIAGVAPGDTPGDATTEGVSE